MSARAVALAEIHHSQRWKTTSAAFPRRGTRSKSFAFKLTAVLDDGSGVALCTGLGRVTKTLARTTSTQSPSIGAQIQNGSRNPRASVLGKVCIAGTPAVGSFFSGSGPGEAGSRFDSPWRNLRCIPPCATSLFYSC